MKKANIHSVKSNNRGLIISALLSESLSRAELSVKTGLSKGAVTLLVNEFIEEGFIREVGLQVSGCVGRPSVKVEIVPEYRYAAGFSLHRKKLAVCLVDLRGGKIAEQSFDTENFTTPESALDCLYSCLCNLLSENDIPWQKLIGIGVSAPGPLDCKSGVILNPPKLDLFHNFKIKEYLEPKANIPVFLDNNAVLLALRDELLREEEFKNCLFIVSADGIGSALIVDGKIFRGAAGFSGELGHTVVVPDGLDCPCGNKGCLERYISPTGLKNRFGEKSFSAALSWDDGEKVLDYVLEYLSTAVINAVNLIDPDAVIIFGELNSPELIRKLNAQLKVRSLISDTHKIAVVPSVLGNESNSLCSTAAILKAFYEQRI